MRRCFQQHYKGFFCQSVQASPTHWFIFVARARSHFILNNNLTLIKETKIPLMKVVIKKQE